MKKYLFLIIVFAFILIGCGTTNNIKDIVIEDINCCGDDFEITNYSFKVIYNDYFEEEVFMTYDMFSNDDIEKFITYGEFDIELNYKGFKKQFHLILEELKVIKIELTTNNITAYVNEFNFSTIILKLYYNDNTSEEVNLEKKYLDRENLLALSTAGTHDIIIKYDDASTVLHIDLLPNEVPIEQLTSDVIIYCSTKKVDNKYQSIFYALGNQDFSSFQFMFNVSDDVTQFDIVNVNESVVYNKKDKNIMVSYVSPINNKGTIELFTIDFLSSHQYANFIADYNLTPQFVYIDGNEVKLVTSSLLTFTR